VWTWGISNLKNSVRGQFYYLYLVVDVWSRKITGAHQPIIPYRDELRLCYTGCSTCNNASPEVNADSRRGLLKVETVPPDGERIEGSWCKDASEVTENGFHVPVAWKSGSRVRDLTDRMTRPRFYLRGAWLYSFRFRAD